MEGEGFNPFGEITDARKDMVVASYRKRTGNQIYGHDLERVESFKCGLWKGGVEVDRAMELACSTIFKGLLDLFLKVGPIKQ